MAAYDAEQMVAYDAEQMVAYDAEQSKLLRHGRRPTMTESKAFTGNRITFMIHCHGGELIDHLLVEPLLTDIKDVQVRIFSTAGALDVCSYNDYDKANKNFNYLNSRLQHVGKDFSTYDIIKDFENNRIDTYIGYISGKYDDEEEQRFLSQAQDSVMRNEHMRTYSPVINKDYFFSDDDEGGPFFIKVVHYDGQDTDKRYESLDLLNKNLVGKAIANGQEPYANLLLQTYLSEHIFSKIKLSTIIAIAKRLGFTIINIIDLSCRSVISDLKGKERQELIEKIKRMEESIAINVSVGGKRSRRPSLKKSAKKRSKKRKRSRKAF